MVFGPTPWSSLTATVGRRTWPPPEKPLYVPDMWRVPAGRLEVTKVAVAEPSAPGTTATSPTCVFPFRKVTLPPEIWIDGTGVVTTAVKVTGWSSDEGFGADERVAAVSITGIITGSATATSTGNGPCRPVEPGLHVARPAATAARRLGVVPRSAAAAEVVPGAPATPTPARVAPN